MLDISDEQSTIERLGAMYANALAVFTAGEVRRRVDLHIRYAIFDVSELVGLGGRFGDVFDIAMGGIAA